MNQAIEQQQVAMKPIIFSTPMVRAILENRKFQTRRMVKPQPIDNREIDGNFFEGKHKGYVKMDGHPNWQKQFAYEFCPYGKVGDILYVRETWRRYFHVDEHGYTKFDQEIIEFAADNPPMVYQMDGDGCIETNKDGSEKFIPWKPCIHMPKKIARIFLKITDISVERLQDITEEDAKAEGIIQDEIGFKDYDKELAKGYGHPDYDFPHFISPIDSFKSLWQLINGEESWEQNPWIWKITFERIEKPSTNTIK